MANITQLPNITTVTNTTTFVVVNNSSTKRISYLTIKDQLSNEIGKISALTDVNISGLSNNQVLKYNTSTHTWTPATIVTGTNTLLGLNDVDVSNRADGEVLTYSTSQGKWVAAVSSSGALNDLTDVVISGTPFDGQVLKYNTSLSAWVNGTDNTNGGGVYSRTTATNATSSIYYNATANISFTGFKSYALLKVQTSAAARVRLYTTSAARSSDSARAQNTNPTPGSGLIAEVITSATQTVLMTPGVFGFNDDATPSTTIYAAVTNLTAGQQAITVTLTLLQLEA